MSISERFASLFTIIPSFSRYFSFNGLLLEWNDSFGRTIFQLLGFSYLTFDCNFCITFQSLPGLFQQKYSQILALLMVMTSYLSRITSKLNDCMYCWLTRWLQGMMMYVPFSRYLFKTQPFQSLLLTFAIKFYNFILLISVYPYALLKIMKPNKSFYYSFFYADSGKTLQLLLNAKRVYTGLDIVKLYWLFLTQSVLVNVMGPFDRNSILIRTPVHLSGYSLNTTILLNFQQSSLMLNLLMKLDFNTPVYGFDTAQVISWFCSYSVGFFFFFFQIIGIQMLERGYILSQVSALSFINPKQTLGELFNNAFNMMVKFYLTVVILLSGIISASNPQTFCIAYCRFGRTAWPRQSFLQAFSRRVLQKVSPFLCLLPTLTYLCVYSLTSIHQSVRTLFLSPPGQNLSKKYCYLSRLG